MTGDHSYPLLRAYSKHEEAGLANEIEILALLDNMLQAKALCLSNLTVEGDFDTVISWMNNRERDPWKFVKWMHKIIDVASELGCSFSLIPCSANQVTKLTK